MESQKQISRQEMASMEYRLVNYLDKVSRASIPSYKAINDCHCTETRAHHDRNGKVKPAAPATTVSNDRHVP